MREKESEREKDEGSKIENKTCAMCRNYKKIYGQDRETTLVVHGGEPKEREVGDDDKGGKKEQVRGKGGTKERLRAITRILDGGWEHWKSKQSGTTVTPTQHAEPIFLLCEICTSKCAGGVQSVRGANDVSQ